MAPATASAAQDRPRDRRRAAGCGKRQSPRAAPGRGRLQGPGRAARGRHGGLARSSHRSGGPARGRHARLPRPLKRTRRAARGRLLLPAALAFVAVLYTGCQSVPNSIEAADPLALLPAGQSAYLLVRAQQSPGLTDALSAGARTEGEAALFRELLGRSEEVAISLGPDGAASVAARGSYPWGSVGFSLATEPGWRRVPVSADGNRLIYWTHTAFPLEVLLPNRELLLAATGEPVGAAAERLLSGQHGSPVPSAVAEGMRKAAFALYSTHPRELLRRGRPDTAHRPDPAPRRDTDPGPDADTDTGSDSDPGRTTAPESGAALRSALAGIVQNRLLESVETVLLLSEAPRSAKGSSEQRRSTDGLSDEAASPNVLETRVELGFSDERTARISLVLVRLSLPNIMAELERRGLTASGAGEPAESSLTVEREGSSLYVDGLLLNPAALGEMFAPGAGSPFPQPRL